MPNTKDTTPKEKNENSKKLKPKRVSNKLPPGIQMAQKLKKRPVSATEPRLYLTSCNPSNELGQTFGTLKYSRSSTGGLKISDNATEPPFVVVFPSNVVKKSVKNSGFNNAKPDSQSSPFHPATTTTTMAAMLSPTGRKPGPGIFTSPQVTAQNLQSVFKSSQNKKSPQLQKKPKSAGSAAGAKPKDTKFNTSNSKPRAKTAAPDLITLTTHPHASPFAKSAAKTLVNAKVRAKDKSLNGNFMETKVVLAPRFGIESNEPSNLTLVPEDDDGSITSLIQKLTKPKKIVSTKTETINVVDKSGDGNFENTHLKIQSNSNFTTEKSLWVQMALDNLSEGWTSTGILSPHIIDLPEFKNKIGDLYDAAVEKKFNEIRKNQAHDLRHTAQKGQEYLQEKSTTRHSVKSNESRFKTEISEEIEKKMSDILLQLLLKKLTPGIPVGKRDVGTNTSCGNCQDSIDGIVHETNSSLSGNSDIHGQREIKTCIVLDGRIIPVETLGNQINSFASLMETRKRNDPTSTGYFRRVSDMRGFEPEDIKLKYVKTRIFVEGRQGQKDERNARLVRETIALPKGLNIDDIKVMRGKRGLIVFEEVFKGV